MYDCWWPPYKLNKMSNYYIMPCTPGNVFASRGVSQMAKYGFEIKWERSRRGHKLYRQRYWKGKWKH